MGFYSCADSSPFNRSSYVSIVSAHNPSTAWILILLQNLWLMNTGACLMRMEFDDQPGETEDQKVRPVFLLSHNPLTGTLRLYSDVKRPDWLNGTDEAV